MMDAETAAVIRDLRGALAGWVESDDAALAAADALLGGPVAPHANEAQIATARRLYCQSTENNVEVPDDALLSDCGEWGYWVQAWLYVSGAGTASADDARSDWERMADEAEQCEECGQRYALNADNWTYCAVCWDVHSHDTPDGGRELGNASEYGPDGWPLDKGPSCSECYAALDELGVWEGRELICRTCAELITEAGNGDLAVPS